MTMMNDLCELKALILQLLIVIYSSFRQAGATVDILLSQAATVFLCLARSGDLCMIF